VFGFVKKNLSEARVRGRGGSPGPRLSSQ